jgi:hypothetical protein
MYETGDSSKEVLSNVYLRYSCSEETMYVLVVAGDGFIVEQLPDDNYVKINNVKVDFLEFEYLNSAEGWEASFLLPEGDYLFNVHTQIYPDRTSALENRELSLEVKCEPTAIGLKDFNQQEDASVTIAAISALVLIIGAVIAAIYVVAKKR